MNRSQPFEVGLVALLPRLRRFAHTLAKNRADADDLTQATVERALRSRNQWQPGTRLDSWTYRIMRNLWIDTARSRSRKEAREAPAEELESIGQDGGSEAAAELARIMAALQQLPVEQREVVSLILVEGFGYREASEILELPIGTVSSRLVRGRTVLLKLVGEG